MTKEISPEFNFEREMDFSYLGETFNPAKKETKFLRKRIRKLKENYEKDPNGNYGLYFTEKNLLFRALFTDDEKSFNEIVCGNKEYEAIDGERQELHKEAKELAALLTEKGETEENLNMFNSIKARVEENKKKIHKFYMSHFVELVNKWMYEDPIE